MFDYNMWFNPENLPKAPPPRATHSVKCKAMGLDPQELMWEFDLLMQNDVFECNHPSHDSVKQIFAFTCDERYEITKPEEGRLV